MSNHTLVAVDLAKSVFEIAVSIQPGRVSERKTLSRSKLLSFFATRRVATIVMEACGSSHHWARELQRLGHRVVLLPPSLVRHAQRGCTPARPESTPSEVCSGSSGCSSPYAMCREIRELEPCIRETEAQLERLAKDLPIVAQLRSIPGIGLLTATALVAFVGDVRRFKNARTISSHLRHRLIHGARSLLRAATTHKEKDHLRAWALAKASRRGPHKGATAVGPVSSDWLSLVGIP